MMSALVATATDDKYRGICEMLSEVPWSAVLFSLFGAFTVVLFIVIMLRLLGVRSIADIITPVGKEDSNEDKPE